MRLRLLIASGLLASLAGCVSVGSTDVLLTPIGVVALHSFKPPAQRQVRDEAVAANNDGRMAPDSDH
ncbi:MAG TPA: hypothetical protein VH542_10565 [Steroidobacteraceae bacterium]|jgi:hypothetical protein